MGTEHLPKNMCGKQARKKSKAPAKVSRIEDFERILMCENVGGGGKESVSVRVCLTIGHNHESVRKRECFQYEYVE
jgi:hypothetical protein